MHTLTFLMQQHAVYYIQEGLALETDLPDDEHGANARTALQWMLMQDAPMDCPGDNATHRSAATCDKILVLPAWPEELTTLSFKLHAWHNTSVQLSSRSWSWYPRHGARTSSSSQIYAGLRPLKTNCNARLKTEGPHVVVACLACSATV